MLLPETWPLDALGETPGSCIQALWRGASRYHFAALQDRHPVVAARHNGYAVALIDALAQIADESEVNRVTGGSLKKLRAEILAFQDAIEEKAFALAREIEAKGIKLI